MAGRPPKSAAAKHAAGNPGKRKIKENIIPPGTAAPPPARVDMLVVDSSALAVPVWISADAAALAQWKALAPEMILRKTLTVWDVNRFGRYCALMGIWLYALDLLRKNGTSGLFQNTKNGLSKSAFISVLLDVDKELRPLEEQFGFSPVSRNKLFATEGDEGLSPAEKELRALEGGA